MAAADRGLDAALSGLAARCPVPVDVRVEVPVRPRPAVEAVAYLLVAEALTNIAKHSRASSATVVVEGYGYPGTLNVMVSDDGIGGAGPAGSGLAGLAEDSVLLREGLIRLLADEGHEVVAAAGDAEGFLRVVAQALPDACIVDVRMPPTFTDEGLRAALVVRDRWPSVGVLVLSQWVEERYATELIAGRPHGVGYLLKDRVADVNIFAKLGLAPADRDHRRVLAVLRYLNGGSS
ncbi:MAG: LuxR family transcriptional regulator [Actinomycetia bacterium]|nr:LuxR family transcriptional regulator [Actinomycetes bacterium]